MPIDINDFNIAKDPSEEILAFLKKEPTKAFSLSEIYEGIPIFMELELSQGSIKDSLDDMIRYTSKIETAWLKGTEYYKITEYSTYL